MTGFSIQANQKGYEKPCTLRNAACHYRNHGFFRNEDSSAFVSSEIARADKTLGEYRNIAFTAFPLVVVVAALLLFFIDKPMWRAISITTIATLACIFLVDSNANARMEVYKDELVAAQE